MIGAENRFGELVDRSTNLLFIDMTLFVPIEEGDCLIASKLRLS